MCIYKGYNKYHNNFQQGNNKTHQFKERKQNKEGEK
jgi:hypothetical protein